MHKRYSEQQNKKILEIRSVKRGICPIAKSTMTELMAECNAHARNGLISTSGLKSNVTIMFLDPYFLKDAKISAIRVHLRQIKDYLFAMIFRTYWPKMEIEGPK